MLSRGRSLDDAELRCLKNRHGEPRDLRLAFDGSLQRFESPDDGATVTSESAAEAIADLRIAEGAGR